MLIRLQRLHSRIASLQLRFHSPSCLPVTAATAATVTAAAHPTIQHSPNMTLRRSARNIATTMTVETQATSKQAAAKKSAASKSVDAAEAAEPASRKRKRTAPTSTTKKARTPKKDASQSDDTSSDPIDADASGAAVESADRPTKKAKVATSTKKTTKKPAASNKKSAASTASTDVSSGVWKHGTVSRDMEDELRSSGKAILLGVDEAGRGPLAGPVVAACIYIPPSVHFEGVNDSKKLDEDEREKLYAQLTTHPEIVHAVSVLEHDVIDKINILEATLLAMQTCVDDVAKQLRAKGVAVDYVLVDGNRLPKTLTHPAEAVVKGDSRVYSIAAASIIAKVTRDRMMVVHHNRWPEYGFLSHRGYGVASHMAAIYRHGPCPIHRMTFAPMKHMKQGKVNKPASMEEKAPPKPRTTKAAQRAQEAAKESE